MTTRRRRLPPTYIPTSLLLPPSPPLLLLNADAAAAAVDHQNKNSGRSCFRLHGHGLPASSSAFVDLKLRGFG